MMVNAFLFNGQGESGQVNGQANENLDKKWRETCLSAIQEAT